MFVEFNWQRAVHSKKNRWKGLDVLFIQIFEFLNMWKFGFLNMRLFSQPIFKQFLQHVG